MSDLQNYLKQQLENPEFHAEYAATRQEFALARALVEARIAANMTQAELAAKSGIRQSNISRIESGACTPTIATLRALADGLGMELSIAFR